MIKYIPWVIIALLLSVIIFLAIKEYRLKKDVDKLSDAINDFTNTGHITGYSLHDNMFARIQNGVADLEDIILFERNRILNENKKSTQFISDVSHQLKTPIAALRLYCEIDNELFPNNSHIEKELQLINKMDKLVYQLLRLEKIKTDSYIMDFQLNDIGALVGEIENELYPIFPEKSITVFGSAKIRCDAAWMSEAIGNLVKNACEHTPADGKINITISENQHSVSIEISDNGGGIQEEEIQNLFTRFYKAENSAPNSTGIGLAITKAIIDKHHGIISAENKNEGLSFTICLPQIDGYEAIE